MAQTCICIPFLHSLGYTKIVKIICVHPISTYVCLTNCLYFPWQKLKNNLYKDLKKYINECKDVCTNKNCLKSPILLSHTNYQFQHIYSSFICILNVLAFKIWYKLDVRQMLELCFHMPPTFTFLVPSHFWYHNSTMKPTFKVCSEFEHWTQEDNLKLK